MSDFYKKDENYDVPDNSPYLKFEEGDNTFRMLGSFSKGTAIQGIVYWKTIDNKRTPIRLPKNPDGTVPIVPASELEMNKFGKKDSPKFFWSLPVWNYKTKSVQILEITQKKIIEQVRKFIDNPKWGNPLDYDFIVTRKDEEITSYSVQVNPKEKIDPAIVQTYEDMKINIQALFSGDDPFTSSTDEVNV